MMVGRLLSFWWYIFRCYGCYVKLPRGNLPFLQLLQTFLPIHRIFYTYLRFNTMDSRLQLSFVTSPKWRHWTMISGPMDQWRDSCCDDQDENGTQWWESWWPQWKLVASIASIVLYIIIYKSSAGRSKIQRLWCLSYQLSRGKKRCLTADLMSLPGIFSPQLNTFSERMGSSNPQIW